MDGDVSLQKGKPSSSLTAGEIFEQLSRGGMPDVSTDEDVEPGLDKSLDDLLEESALFKMLDSLEKQNNNATETELMDQSEVRDPTYVPTESESDNESTNESVHSGNIDLHANEAEHDAANQVEQDQVVNPARDQQAENEPPRKRSKKAQPNTWQQNKKKRQREKGEPYVGARKVKKPGRSLKPRCNCKLTKSRQCGSFSEGERETIFNNVWKGMKWDGRKGYVRGLVDAVPTSRSRTDADHSRKNTTFRYHLKRDGERKVVCKSMFLSTTGLGRWSVQQWARGLSTPTTAAVRSGYYDRAKEAREFMRTEFFKKNCLKCLPTTVVLT